MLYAGGIYENEAVTIGSDIIFRPLVVTVKGKGDVDYIREIEKKRLGYVSFVYKGRTVNGFLSKDVNAVNITPLKEKACDFKLLLSADSEYRL